MLTKTSDYLDSLRIDQEERQRQRQTKHGNRSCTKTLHNADKDQRLPWFSPCWSGREAETETDQAREQIIHKNTAKTPHNADKDWWLPWFSPCRSGRETETEQAREQILHKNSTQRWQRPVATLILSVSIRKRVMLLRRTSKKKVAWLRKELTSWGSVCAGRRMLVSCWASSSWTVRWLLPLATAGGRNTYCDRQARSWTWQTEMQNSTTVLLWETERIQQQRRIRLYCAEPGGKTHTEARITL